MARLPAKKLGVRNRDRPPKSTEEQIVAWAREWWHKQGVWPSKDSGTIAGSNGETWLKIDKALRRRGRGLPRTSSLARLLSERCGKRNFSRPPNLSPDDVVRWGRAHRERRGTLPTARSGPIAEAPGETWLAVNSALHKGGRGFPGGSSLARFFREQLS